MPELTKEERKRIANRRTDAYHKRAFHTVTIRFHKRNYADVLARIDSMPNKTDYIRKLVRKDIEENGLTKALTKAILI